jgi:hypothetical protein
MSAAYELVDFPAIVGFRDAKLGELHAYYDWFISKRQARIASLQIYINSHLETSWTPDGSRGSILLLQSFAAVLFAGGGSAKSRSIEMHGQNVSVSDWQLNDLSLSLSFDIGVYFGEALISNHPCLKWQHWLQSKRDADYGHAVVAGFDAEFVNPIRISKNCAFAILRGMNDRQVLVDAFDYWSSRAKFNS